MDNQFSQLSLDNLTSLRNLIITNNSIDSLDFSFVLRLSISVLIKIT